MKKEKRLFVGGVLLLLLTIVTCYTVSGTYAQYASEVTGSDSARVAKWSWSIGGNDITSANKTFTMDDLFAANKIYELTDDACTTTADTEVTQTEALVAPGTCGKVSINVTNNSEVAATYSYTLTETNDNHIPIKYSLTGAANSWKTIDELNTASAGTEVDITMGATKNITLYWKWDFTTSPAEVDDTELGFLAAATETAPKVKLEATLNLAQKN